MNTPKLISILNNSVGHAEQARVGKTADPSHGLDFSRLLGERQSQNAAQSSPRPSPSESLSRSFERKAADNRDTAHRSAGNETSARNTQEAARPANRGSEPANERNNVPATRDSASGNTRNSDTQNANQPVTGTQPTNNQAAADRAGSEASPAAGNEVSPTTAAPTDAQLAQTAAEAGVSGMVLSQSATPAAGLTATNGTAATTGAAQAAALAQSVLPQGAAAAADSATSLLPATEAEAQPGVLANTAQLAAARASAIAVPVNAGNTMAETTDAGLPSTLDQLPVAQAAASSEQLAALAKPTVAASDNAPAQPNPIAAALPVASSTAAARSLQEFTAMVAAARATSGTPLASNVTATPATPQPTMPGMMPAASFATTLASTSSLAQGSGIAAPLNSPQWSAEFGRQFIRIAQAGNGLGQVAELRLDPPDLGPLRITINLSDNVAHAVISSPHALVRQTVENALPQLQQMLEQAGLTLGQANVNDQGQAEQGFPGEGRQTARHTGAGNGSDDAGTQAGVEARPAGRAADPDALVDTFA